MSPTAIQQLQHQLQVPQFYMKHDSYGGDSVMSTAAIQQLQHQLQVPQFYNGARQLLRGQCHEPSCHPTAAAPVTGTAVLHVALQLRKG
jgi:hypothetical protein